MTCRTCIASHVGTRLRSWFSFLFMACAATIVQILELDTVDPGNTPFHSVSILRHYTPIWMLTSGLGALTGAIHYTIWTFQFPSHAEVLCRTATALATAYPFLMFLAVSSSAITPKFMYAVRRGVLFMPFMTVLTSFKLLLCPFGAFVFTFQITMIVFIGITGVPLLRSLSALNVT